MTSAKASPPRYEDALGALVDADPSIVVLTAESRSPFRGLIPHLGARFVDFGIAEQTMVGAAAGLALRGRRPIVHSIAAFLTMRAFEFIRTDVGIARLPVKLIGSLPGFLSDANGPTHQALEDVALMRGVPGMHVFCPADVDELCAALPTIVASPAPTYVRYNPLPAAAPHPEPFAVGRAEVLAEGDDATLLVYGFLLREALAARALLAAAGLSVGLVNLRMPKPVDEEAIVRAARRSRLLVTVEDHFETGGLCSIVAEVLARRRVAAPALHPIALAERWFAPGLLGDVLAHEGFTGERIAARVQGALATL